MKWFLVLWVATGGTIAGMGLSSGMVSTQLKMPSQEVCETIRDLNGGNNGNAECWSKPATKSKPMPMRGDQEPFIYRGDQGPWIPLNRPALQ